MKLLAVILCLLFATNLYSQERYEIKCPPDKSYAADLYQKNLNDIVGIGENEINNRGKELDEWANIAGLPNPKNPKQDGWSWCQIKSVAMRIKAGYLPYPKTGLANAPFNYAKKYGYKTLCKPHVSDEQKWKDKYSSSGHNEDIVFLYKNGNTLNNAGNVGPHSKTNDAKRSKVCLIIRTPGKALNKNMPDRGYVGFDFS
jgi:hypothetical protein